MRPFTIAVLVISLLATGAHAQGWGGALEGGARGMQQSIDTWQRVEREKELIKQQNEFLMEQDRIQAERERQLILERRAQELARQQEQRQAEERIQRERASLAAERAKLEMTRAKLAVEQAHPGWESAIRTEQFSAWRKGQPASVQRLGESDDPKDAILMLDLYKRDTAVPMVVQKNVPAKRNPKARAEFMRQQPCPATGKSKGACPGYVVDHLKPIACGGADAPGNMQWKTTAEAKAKDAAGVRC